MNIRKQKKLFKQTNNFINLMYLKSVKDWCRLYHKRNRMFRDIDKLFIRFDNRMMKKYK